MDDSLYKDDDDVIKDDKLKETNSVISEDAKNLEVFFTVNCHQGIELIGYTEFDRICNILKNIFQNLEQYPQYFHLVGEILLPNVIPSSISQKNSEELQIYGYKLYNEIIYECPDLFDQQIAHSLIEQTHEHFGSNEEINHCCWDFLKTVFTQSKEEKNDFLQSDGLNFTVSQFLECDDFDFSNQIASLFVTLIDENFSLEKEQIHHLFFTIKDKLSSTSFFCQFITKVLKSMNDDLVDELYRLDIDSRLFTFISQLHEEFDNEASDLPQEKIDSILEHLKTAQIILEHTSSDYDIEKIPIIDIFDFAKTGTKDVSLYAFRFIFSYISRFEEYAITILSQNGIISKLSEIYPKFNSSFKQLIVDIILECFYKSTNQQLNGLLILIGLHPLLDFAQTENKTFIDKLASILERMINCQLTNKIFRFWQEEISDNEDEDKPEIEDSEIIDRLIEINDDAENERLDEVIQQLIKFHEEARDADSVGSYSSSSSEYEE